MDPYRRHYSHQSAKRNITPRSQRLSEMYSMYSSDDEDLALTSSSTAAASISKGSQVKAKISTNQNPIHINQGNDSLSSPKSEELYTLVQYQQRQVNDISDSDQFDRIYPDLPWNYIEEKQETTDALHTSDDPILSQKMGQLSTSAHEKCFLLNDIKQEIEKTPNYLIKQNASFQQMIHQIQSKTTTNSIEKIREIAILINKIMVIQTYDLQWTAYLKSSLGQLIIPTNVQPLNLSTIPIWPKVIKTMLQVKDKDKSNENEIYSNFVHQQLFQLNHQLKQYQMALNTKINHFQGYTMTIQNLIEKYIEQNLQSFRMKIEHEIELLRYDYYIQVFKLEYLKHHPNKDQIQLMKQICQSSYEREAAEQEYQLLLQQITHHNLPGQSFENSLLVQSLDLNLIENVNLRQQVFNQYKEVAVEAKAKLCDLYMKTAQVQREKFNKKHTDNIQKVYFNLQSLNSNQKLSPIMFQLIRQRCDQIEARVKCVYKFKAESIQSSI